MFSVERSNMLCSIWWIFYACVCLFFLIFGVLFCILLHLYWFYSRHLTWINKSLNFLWNKMLYKEWKDVFYIYKICCCADYFFSSNFVIDIFYFKNELLINVFKNISEVELPTLKKFVSGNKTPFSCIGVWYILHMQRDVQLSGIL